MTADGMTPQAEARGNVGEPYSLAKVLGIWDAAALPMGLLAWVIGPTISPYLPVHPGSRT